MESAGLLTRSYFRLADCPRRSLQQIKDRHTRVAVKRIALYGAARDRWAATVKIRTVWVPFNIYREATKLHQYPI